MYEHQSTDYWNEAQLDGASQTCQPVLKNNLYKVVDLTSGATHDDNSHAFCFAGVNFLYLKICEHIQKSAKNKN